MSSQEEHNKLTDEEKFKLIEFYKENSKLWVTPGIKTSQKALKKVELEEEFDTKFSIKTLEKGFHALKASFLWERKKDQREGNLTNKGWKFYESIFFWKTSQRPVKWLLQVRKASVTETWNDRVQRSKYSTYIDSKIAWGV